MPRLLNTLGSLTTTKEFFSAPSEDKKHYNAWSRVGISNKVANSLQMCARRADRRERFVWRPRSRGKNGMMIFRRAELPGCQAKITRRASSSVWRANRGRRFIRFSFVLRIADTTQQVHLPSVATRDSDSVEGLLSRAQSLSLITGRYRVSANSSFPFGRSFIRSQAAFAERRLLSSDAT